MKGQRRPHQEWQVAVLQYACPACGQPPGKWCLTSTGHIMHEPHADRARLASNDGWNAHLDDEPGHDDGS